MMYWTIGIEWRIIQSKNKGLGKRCHAELVNTLNSPSKPDHLIPPEPLYK